MDSEDAQADIVRIGLYAKTAKYGFIFWTLRITSVGTSPLPVVSKLICLLHCYQLVSISMAANSRSQGLLNRSSKNFYKVWRVHRGVFYG